MLECHVSQDISREKSYDQKSSPAPSFLRFLNQRGNLEQMSVKRPLKIIQDMILKSRDQKRKEEQAL